MAFYDDFMVYCEKHPESLRKLTEEELEKLRSDILKVKVPILTCDIKQWLIDNEIE